MAFWIAFGVLFLCLVVESILSLLFIQGCKKYYRELWIHAGKPNLKSHGDLTQAWPLIKYLLLKKYQTIENNLAVAYANQYRWLLVISYFGAITAAIAVISVMIFIGLPH